MYELISECQWSKKEILEVIEALQEKNSFYQESYLQELSFANY